MACTGVTARASPSWATAATLCAWALVRVASGRTTPSVVLSDGAVAGRAASSAALCSTVGVLMLIVANLGFRAYLHYGADFGATYGALAGALLLMLWLYLAALALLVGAEINCVIRHAAAHGKTPPRPEPL